MTHPDDGTVALLSIAFAAVGTLFAVAVGVVLWLNTGRLLPSRGSRAAYWIGVAFFAPAIVVAVPAAAEASKATAVIASRGWDDYAGGLRVVNKHGLLSDGSYLPAAWAAAVVPMIWTAVLVLGVLAAAWHLSYHPLRIAANHLPENQSAKPDAAPDTDQM